MNRFFALVLALLFASLTVSSACVAAESDWTGFRLEQNRHNPGLIEARFRNNTRDRDNDSWSSSFRPSDLIGLDAAGFRGAGTRPLRFAVIRDAGRLDCAGNGGEAYASGNCTFTPDAGFAQHLVRARIGRPNRSQSFGMMAVDVRRATVDALAAARYPAPSINDLMALSAVGVTGGYIHGMAGAGYRPSSIHGLIEFRALGVTPEWIGGFARIGYANIPQQELIQLRAMGITPEFIAGFDRIGYRHLPPTTLVQLRALDITPDFVRRAVGVRSTLPPVDELVQLKTTGRWR